MLEHTWEAQPFCDLERLTFSLFLRYISSRNCKNVLNCEANAVKKLLTTTKNTKTALKNLCETWQISWAAGAQGKYTQHTPGQFDDSVSKIGQSFPAFQRCTIIQIEKVLTTLVSTQSPTEEMYRVLPEKQDLCIYLQSAITLSEKLIEINWCDSKQIATLRMKQRHICVVSCCRSRVDKNWFSTKRTTCFETHLIVLYISGVVSPKPFWGGQNAWF